ncbi:MAG: hypothetical protein IT385_23240 [Deltaproteobacteria bacterium]|nr:hypothetical protein [Deltaproteobacteria bacterium]
MDDRGFAEHERAQLRRWSALSYAERLRWLWEAKLFAARALAAARAREAQATERAPAVDPDRPEAPHE